MKRVEMLTAKQEYRKHGIRLAVLCLSACVLSGCATTVFTSTWKTPDAERIASLQGQKVLAFVLVSNETVRCKTENALAAELTRQGAVGIAGYTIAPDITDKAKAKELVLKAGAAGVVTMRLIGRTEETVSIVQEYTDLTNWEAYWNKEWDHAWQPPAANTSSIVTVETRVYLLKQNKLLWGGKSETADPYNVEKFIKSIMRATVAEMKKAGAM